MPESLLITGATGHIGTALLPRLLTDPDLRVLALLRARDPAHLEERLARLRAPLGEAGARLHAVAGDVSSPGLGLSALDRQRVLSECDAILHSAASVRFDMPEEQAAAQNIAGVTSVIELASQLATRGNLRRLDHVSTAYVAGARTDRVFEHELAPDAVFRNSYEWSKHQGEQKMRAAMAKGLPICVHRPSIVVGDSKTGETDSFNVLYWPLKLYLRGWWRTFPGRPDALVDIVPVDFVADALVRLRDNPASLGGTFHLAAGDASATVEALVTRIRSFTDAPPMRVVEQGAYKRWVRPLLWPLFQTKRGATIRRGGDAYMPYFLGNPTFDTTAAAALLGDLAPPAVEDFLERVVRYAMTRDFGGR